MKTTTTMVKTHLGRAIVWAALATVVFLFASVLWGLVVVYQLELCQPKLIACDLAKEAWMHPLRGAPFVALPLFACVYGLKSRLNFADSKHFVMLAVLYSSLLVLIYPHVYDFREYLAIHFFPYVISLRFGDLGFALAWGFITVFAAILATFTFYKFGNRQH